jgi:hypothetical protein
MYEKVGRKTQKISILFTITEFVPSILVESTFKATNMKRKDIFVIKWKGAKKWEIRELNLSHHISLIVSKNETRCRSDVRRK